MRGERWWWLAGFVFLSGLIHVLLALHGPGFGIKNGFSASPKEIELTLEPLPPAKKPRVAVAKPRAVPVVKQRLTPKVAVKPLPVVKPPLKQRRAPLLAHNPISMPEDQPQAAEHTDLPHLSHALSQHPGRSGGGERMALGPQIPTEQPKDNSLPAGIYTPHLAVHAGGAAFMHVDNPLAEDAVPEEKPGLSAGSGGGLNGKTFASLRTGIGPGTGGGIGGGHGAGHGSRPGRGVGIDEPGVGGDGYGLIGSGLKGRSFRIASGGRGVFNDVGGLLHGDPPRTPGDGRAGRDGHGLDAEIYEGKPYLTTLTHHRTDAVIDFNWGTTAAIINGVSRLFSVRWSGQIESKYSETYKFVTLEDDGLRVWVDGKLIINDWNDHKPAEGRGSIFLEAGRKYDIKIEYFENGIGHAEVHLRWTSPSQPLEIVPESALWQAR